MDLWPREVAMWALTCSPSNASHGRYSCVPQCRIGWSCVSPARACLSAMPMHAAGG